MAGCQPRDLASSLGLFLRASRGCEPVGAQAPLGVDEDGFLHGPSPSGPAKVGSERQRCLVYRSGPLEQFRVVVERQAYRLIKGFIWKGALRLLI